MRSRARAVVLVPLIAVLGAGMLLPACGGDDSLEKTSEDRAGTDEQSSGAENEGSTDSEGDSGSGDESDSGSEDGSDDSIPDLDDLTESIPGLEQMGDCLEIAAAYGSLYFEALGGADGAEAALQKAEELKSVLPEDLYDDIDVVAEAIGEIAEEGLFSGSEALDSPEYQAADQAITEYLNEQCGGATGGGQGDGEGA